MCAFQKFFLQLLSKVTNLRFHIYLRTTNYFLICVERTRLMRIYLCCVYWHKLFKFVLPIYIYQRAQETHWRRSKKTVALYKYIIPYNKPIFIKKNNAFQIWEICNDLLKIVVFTPEHINHVIIKNRINKIRHDLSMFAYIITPDWPVF